MTYSPQAENSVARVASHARGGTAAPKDRATSKDATASFDAGSWTRVHYTVRWKGPKNWFGAPLASAVTWTRGVNADGKATRVDARAAFQRGVTALHARAPRDLDAEEYRRTVTAPRGVACEYPLSGSRVAATTPDITRASALPLRDAFARLREQARLLARLRRKARKLDTLACKVGASFQVPAVTTGAVFREARILAGFSRNTHVQAAFAAACAAYRQAKRGA